MCGIAGWIGASDEHRPDIRVMLDALRHRGPDDEGFASFPSATLGSRRLSIIDLAGGRQPIANEDGTISVVCNGEIYNYKALRAQLQEAGHSFRTESDTEVILHLYEDEGERCLAKLRGMFAFAIWDNRRKRFFAARDRLGQKPFFYAHRGSDLLFASEIKSILAVEPGLAEMDLAALDQYLALRIIAPPLTMFSQIRKLPPGHCMTFDLETGLKIESYWSLRYEPKLPGSDDDLEEELIHRIVDSLEHHMVSDVPVGAFLSGGLDSTLIVAMLSEHLGVEALPTFSMGLEYGDFDERPYAAMVARKFSTDHHQRRLTASIARSLPELVWHLDEPSDPLSVCTYRLAEFARQHVKVVLGGDGGDELFAGYDRYYGNRIAGRYSLLPWPLRKWLIGPVLGALPDGDWYKSRAHQMKWLHEASFRTGAERYAHSLGYFYFSRSQRQELYGPGARNRSLDLDPEAPIREAFDEAFADDDVDRMLSSDSSIRLPDHSTMILDRTTMAHGLEARSPFLDHELAEFCARLPVSMKIRGRSLRDVQKRLAARYLPKAVLDRPKQGFSSPLPYLMRDEYAALYGLFLRRSELAQQGFFDQKAVDRFLTEGQSRKFDHGNRLWLLLNAEVWYRMHILRTSPADLSAQIDEAQHGRGGPSTR